MLRAAIAFFALALLAFFVGEQGIAGFSAEIGKALVFLFMVLAIISFLFGLVMGKSPSRRR